MDRLKVVILDEELPYPATSGKRIRTLNLVRRLASRHDITYLAHRNRNADEARLAQAHLQELGIRVVVVDRAVPSHEGLGFYLRLAGNLFSPRPYSVEAHHSQAFRRAASEHVGRHQVDLWQCEWTPYAMPLLGGAREPWIVMAHNVESLIWRRYWETERNPARRWFIKAQWRKYERFEREVFSRATQTVAVSEVDARLAAESYGAKAVSVVDNGVDAGFFVPGPRPAAGRRVLFLGSLDWRPNLDAVQILVDTIFPLLRAKIPAAELDIVGRNPPAWLGRLIAECPGANLHANVADVRPYVHAAGVMAVPLRIGGGSRLKILEALACRLPVVSTRVGCEGLELEAGEHLLVEDDNAAFAAALGRCLNEPSESLAMADRGREVVLNRYDWDSLADRLDEIWRRAAGRPARALAGAAT